MKFVILFLFMINCEYENQIKLYKNIIINLINHILSITMTRYLRSDAPLFSPEDYEYIRKCRNKKPRSKVLNELMKKYNTSMKRIYKIWRGEEHPIDPSLTINQDISTSEENGSPICEINEVEKSLDIARGSYITSQAMLTKSNIEHSTKIRDMITFHCTSCGHPNRILTKDINRMLTERNNFNEH